MSEQGKDISKLQNDVQLQKLQLAELEILKSVTAALDKNNIKYYLGFGTLLGAIRHQGFIPWDDDVDLFLPRSDYEQFINVADQILEKPYYLHKVKGRKYPFDKYFLQVESQEMQNLRKNGDKVEIRNIQIDIFALDGIPESKWLQFLIFLYLRFLCVMWRFAKSAEYGVDVEKERSLIEKIGILINERIKIGRLLSIERILARIDQARRKYPYEKYDSVYALTTDYHWQRLICKKKWFEKGKKVLFEGNLMTVPINSDAVLRQIYGDYMKLPLKEERVCKHILGVVDRGESIES